MVMEYVEGETLRKELGRADAYRQVHSPSLLIARRRSQPRITAASLHRRHQTRKHHADAEQGRQSPRFRRRHAPTKRDSHLDADR